MRAAAACGSCCKSNVQHHMVQWQRPFSLCLSVWAVATDSSTDWLLLLPGLSFIMGCRLPLAACLVPPVSHLLPLCICLTLCSRPASRGASLLYYFGLRAVRRRVAGRVGQQMNFLFIRRCLLATWHSCTHALCDTI